MDLALLLVKIAVRSKARRPAPRERSERWPLGKLKTLAPGVYVCVCVCVTTSAHLQRRLVQKIASQVRRGKSVIGFARQPRTSG